MGSSKKHKEKDREREHKHKKRKRSRSRSRSYEKKVKKSQHDKVLNDSIYHLDKRDDHKYKRGDNGSLPHDSVSKNELHDSGGSSHNNLIHCFCVACIIASDDAY